jgi:hypothetical protein
MNPRSTTVPTVAPDAPVPPVAPPRRQKGAIATLRDLWPYMWPQGRPDLKRRVVVALSILIAAKIITVLVPYTFKWVTDALTGNLKAPGSVPVGLAIILAVPVLLVAANGVGRVLMNVFNNLRDALFA